MHARKKQYQVFYVYNLYRLLLIAVFLCMYVFSFGWSYHSLSPLSFEYPLFLILYFLLSALIFYCARLALVDINHLVMLSNGIDLVFLNLFVIFAGGITQGAGIFINIAIAAFSLLRPGRWALFFAAVASSILLSISAYQLFIYDNNTFYYAGIHGVGLFATALTAVTFAHWLSASERLASQRSDEVCMLERLNEQIIERLQSGIIYVDDVNTIRIINQAAKEYFKQSQPEPGQSLDVVCEELGRIVRQWREAEPSHLQHKKKLLTATSLLVHYIPTHHMQGVSSIVVLEDISRTVQHAQQLKLASLGRFTASIAHELRNPLGAISHAVQLLAESHQLKPEDSRLIEIIDCNCNRMNALIKNILQLSRRQKSHPTAITPSIFLKQFADEFTTQHPAVAIDIKIGSSPLPLYFDKSQLHQVLVILAENSAKYGKNVDLQTKITLTVARDTHQFAYILFEDSGKGIDSVIQNEIFEPFFTTSRTGVGLGLFIAKELCEANQAMLSIINKKQGACFKIVFNQTEELLL